MAELKITKENFEKEVLHADKPVLLDFWATWCGPCRMLAPIVEEIAETHQNEIYVGKVNVDEEPELAEKFGIVSIPTVILMKNGQISATSVGYKPKEAFEALLH